MTKREQMIECAEAMEQGMMHTQTTRDMWQNNLIWWICKAVKLLLEREVKRSNKSLIRIVGCYMGVHGNLHGMAMSFIFAEAMGILEELADER